MSRFNISLTSAIVVAALAVVCGFLIVNETRNMNDNHFVLLAQSFLKNDLFLSPVNLPPGDYADYLGRQYLFFGPATSLILVPFVLLIGPNFSQIFLSLCSLVITYFAILLMCRKLGFYIADSIWFANFFVFGTVLYFVSLINISAYVVQAVGVTFVVLALLEYFSLKRWLVIGILIAFAGAARFTLFLAAVFFILEIVRNKSIDFRKSLSLLMIPIVISLILLGVYNYRRFNSVFDSGYTRNVTVVNSPSSNYMKGAFSLVHISGNLYNLLMAAPEAVKEDAVDFVLKFPYIKVNGIGLSLIFTSPLFIYLILAKRKGYTISAAISIAIILVPSLIYFGIGTTQFGYRYSLDFQPLLFLILLSSFEKRISNLGKLLITVGILFNCLYCLSIWNSYPVFTLLGLI